MPPIRQQLDEAFLVQLLEQQEVHNISDILNTNIDSKSLSLVLKRLDSTSHAFQQELIQQVHTHFDEFASSYNTSQKLHNDVLELVKKTTSTQEKVAYTQFTVTESIEAYQEALAASQDNKKKIDFLNKLQHMLQVVDLIHQELKETDYVKAVQHVLELELVLTTWHDQQQTVLDMMKQRIEQLKQSLIQQLEEEVRSGLQYNMGSMRILTRAFSEKQVFECLDQLGLLAETMMGVQRQIFKHILNPYFDHLHVQLQVNHVHVDRLGSGGVLQVIPVTREEEEEEEEEEEVENRLDPVYMMQQMDTVLSFFYKYIFDNKSSNMNLLFGNLLLPDLMDKMISRGISPSIPSSKETLDQFNTITQHVSTFEGQLASYGFLPDTETSLGHYVQQIDTHYAKHRRNKILQQGREVMLRQLYEAEMVQVLEEDGHMYKYQITQTPQILAVLISDTILEAHDLLASHPISASTLVEGVQDLLDMYRAMMPSFHRPRYLSSPAKSMVFRNDCLWLSHQLITSIKVKIQQQQQPRLIETLQSSATRLIELGKAWHELTMMHQVQMIQHVLDNLDGFSGMGRDHFQQDCEQAIIQVIQLIQSFASDVCDVVDWTVFLDMMGRLVDTCLERLIDDIEELVDIGAQESHVIAVTLNSFAQLAVPGAAFGQDANDAFVAELVPSWSKFWLLKDILEMNMKEIMQAFRKGDLHMFEKNELVCLLCALFADTELRESNIREIKFGGSSEEVDNHIRQQDDGGVRFVSRQETASIKTMTQSISSNALEYTLDEDTLEQEGTGWGDEDDGDLFAANDALTMVTPLDTNTNTTHSMAPMEIDFNDDDDEGEGGWGDADQDIFMNQQPNETMETIPKEDKEEEESQATMKQEEDDKPHDDKLINSSDHHVAAAAAATTNTTQPLVSSLDLKAIDDEIDLELEEQEGEGWGWDDEDEDLFKDEQDELR